MSGPRRMLTFRSGGWVLLLAALLTCAAVATSVVPLLRATRSRAVGDGKHVASYGFDLSTCLVPRQRIEPSGLPKDGIPALVSPRTIPADEAGTLPGGHGKFLVGGDRVIGVVIGGEARAYPLRVLAWHEVANDTLGGAPIAITYNPLSEGIAVVDRRVGGEVLDFGVSGLLYDSTLLMYDRRAGGRGESLWSQLEARAVVGPAAAAGRILAPLPCSLARWQDWRARHPGTTVIVPEHPAEEKYQREPYATYFNSDRLVVPVTPLPPKDGLPLKARVLAIRDGAEWRLFALDGKPEPPDRVDLGPERVEIDASTRPASVLVSGTSGSPRPMFYAFWFAWYATHSANPGTIVGTDGATSSASPARTPE